jgi:gluconolactonase
VRREMSDPTAESVAHDLGWPEGPTIAGDGGVVFVESYRSQLTVWKPDGSVEQRAYVVGAPNSCVHGAGGELYVCQNGGTVGPWRAGEMTDPGIQRVDPDGTVTTILTEVGGVTLNGPNDLVFGPDGHLYFTDPGTYDPEDPDPSYIYAIDPSGEARLVRAFDEPVFPNGLVVEPDGSVVWDESYTGKVGRLRPDGDVQDLGKLPNDGPIPDGMTIGADGRLFVADLASKGIHVLLHDGTVDGFIACGNAPTNCAFSGETLFVTDAGVLATSDEPSLGGKLWRLTVPGGGPDAYTGSIGAR